MHRMTKLLALTLALVLIASCFAACGSKSSAPASGDNAAANDNGPASANTEAPAAPAADVQSWGNISLAVPEGYTLKGGSLFDEEDPDQLTISGQGLDYFQVSIVESEEDAKDNLDMTKSLNEELKPEDVTVTANGVTWTGVYYNSYGYDCFQVYAKLNGKIVQVNGCGCKQDSSLANAVLSSIVVK